MIRNLYKILVLSLGSNEQKIKMSRKLGVSIGQNCSILGRANWGSEPYLIQIGDNVRITSGVKFITHDGAVHVLRNKYGNKSFDLFGSIKVGNNVFIGVDAIILPNTTIGDNVIIGAKSVVTKNLESNGIYAGNPAKFIMTVDDYFKKKKKDMINTACLGNAEKKDILTKLFD